MSRTQIGTRLLGSGAAVQSQRTPLLSFVSFSGSTPAQDDTIPQSSEGVELGTVSITPKSASNILRVEAVAHVGASASVISVTWILRDSNPDAIGVSGHQTGNNTGFGGPNIIVVDVVAGSISLTTFKLRIGNNGGGTSYLNGQSSRLYGGALMSYVQVTEFAA